MNKDSFSKSGNLQKENFLDKKVYDIAIIGA